MYFIDLNNLKDYNKQGYLAGDDHILFCTKYIISNYLLISDVFVRYGGDEFVILSVSPKCVCTNCLYSVGESKILNGLDDSIKAADKQMMRNKVKFKLTEPI